MHVIDCGGDARGDCGGRGGASADHRPSNCCQSCAYDAVATAVAWSRHAYYRKTSRDAVCPSVAAVDCVRDLPASEACPRANTVNGVAFRGAENGAIYDDRAAERGPGT